ncbi:MAG: XdhC family protein [Bradymonadales bacterium]|nr:XdhC family protein [Bradymonadales bacterium]
MEAHSSIDAVLQAQLEASRNRTPCVLVTVVGYTGSTPRKPGAKMLVFGDGRTVGTVGGGALEHFLLGKTQEVMTHHQPSLLERIPLNELGMECGGTATVLLEPQQYPARLYLFGAGHVAQPFAHMAALAEFDVVVIDERADLATQGRFPDARTIIAKKPVEAIDQLEFDAESSYVVVVTHSHPLDVTIVSKVMPRPFRYLGVIGSVRKKASLFATLAAQGFTESQLARIQMPVGLEIGAETPVEIAVAILAQLIATRRAAVVEAPS